MIGLRAEGVAHLRPVDRDLRDAVAAELVADVLERRRRAASRLPWSRQGYFPSRDRRRLAPARRRRAARSPGDQRHHLRRAARPRAARSPARSTPGERVPLGGLPGEDFAVAAPRLPAARSGRGAGAAEGRTCLAPNDRRRRGTGGERARPRRARRSSSGRAGRRAQPKEVVLTYGNWLWSALGSAVALGHPPSRALAVRAAAHPRRRALDPPAQRRSPAPPSSCTSAGTPTPSCSASTTRRSSRSSRRRSSACSTPACASRRRCAGRCSAARRSRRRCSSARRRRASRSRPTYGLTEACSQVTTNGVPLFCTRVALARRRRDPRRAARRSPAAGRCTPATSAAGRGRAPADRRPQGRHDHHRRRERRARRGRGRARGAPGGRRGRRPRAARPGVGRGGRRDRRPQRARRRPRS